MTCHGGKESDAKFICPITTNIAIIVPENLTLDIFVSMFTKPFSGLLFFKIFLNFVYKSWTEKH